MKVWKVLQTVLAGLLGVQSERKRAEDFSQHKFWHIALVGGLLTLVLLLANALLVKGILQSIT